MIILTGRERRETAGKPRHMCWRHKLVWLDIRCLPGGFKMITPYCAQVIILSALTHNRGNGSGGVRMANSPIVYQLHEGRATGNEATPGGAIGQSAHCVSTLGGRR